MQVMSVASLHVGRTAPVRCPARAPRGRLCRVMALHEPDMPAVSRREQLLAALSVAALAGVPPAGAAGAAQPSYFSDEFTETPSGLRFLDIRVGDGAAPQPGDTCVVHWSGYTKGYQGKRVGNSSVDDEPYEFVLGEHQAIAAFEEAVAGMKAGGLRRIEIPGSKPALGFPLDRKERFTNEPIFQGKDKVYKYRYGPQPIGLFGQRALDFVLDNPTLQDFNRDLLYDIRLLSVRPAKK